MLKEGPRPSVAGFIIVGRPHFNLQIHTGIPRGLPDLLPFCWLDNRVISDPNLEAKRVVRIRAAFK
jgi:hypothetical protein